MAYHRHGAQMPLTPPDSGSRYGYSNMHYPQKTYTQTMHQPAREYDYNTYMPPTLPPVSQHYTQSLYQGAAAAASMTTLPSISSYYEPAGAPILPPLRVNERMSYDDYRQYNYTREQPRQVKEEKATGGVSAKLDYDMDRMTNFVVEYTQKMYALHLSPICVADIDIMRSCQQTAVSPPAFRKWVHQVLSATRLPSATILLSLHYLSDRFQVFPDSIPAGSDQIYRLLTVALILGSKFLDDNTFINRSWSDVTSIKVSELNLLELQWLQLIEYGLHVDNSCVQPWVDVWKQYERSLDARLAPLDTHDRSRYAYPPPYSRYDRSYQAPYSAVDSWSERPAYEDFYKRGSVRYPTLSDFDEANRRADEQRHYQGYQYSAPYSATAAPGYSWDYGWSNVHRSDCVCSACAYRSWRPHSNVNGYNMGTVMG